MSLLPCSPSPPLLCASPWLPLTLLSQPHPAGLKEGWRILTCLSLEPGRGRAAHGTWNGDTRPGLKGQPLGPLPSRSPRGQPAWDLPLCWQHQDKEKMGWAVEGDTAIPTPDIPTPL